MNGEALRRGGVGSKNILVLILDQTRDSVQTPPLSHGASLAGLVQIHGRITSLQ